MSPQNHLNFYKTKLGDHILASHIALTPQASCTSFTLGTQTRPIAIRYCLILKGRTYTQQKQEQTLHNTETCSRPRFYSLNARKASHSSVFTASAMSLVYTMRSPSLTSANTSTYMRPPLATHFAGIVKLDKCTAIMQVTYLRTGVALTMHADVQ